MKAFAICDVGAEELCAAEIKELAGVDCKKGDVITFDAGVSELCRFCYASQSASRVCLHIMSTEFLSISDLKRKIAKADIGKYLQNGTFAVRCIKRHTDVLKQKVEAAIGSAILKAGKLKKAIVNLTNPDMVFIAFIFKNRLYLGIDLIGFDAGKRDYKLFMPSFSLRGTIAYSLVRLSGFKDGDVLLNPLCGDGVIGIEAARYAAMFPTNFFRKRELAFTKLRGFREFDFDAVDGRIKKKIKGKIFCVDSALSGVRNAERNAKAARVNHLIKCSKRAVDELDLIFGKGEVNRIVCTLPWPSKTYKQSEAASLYKEFFYQAEHILARNGRIVLLCKAVPLLQQFAAMYGFGIEHKMVLWQGKEPLDVSVWIKKKIKKTK